MYRKNLLIRFVSYLQQGKKTEISIKISQVKNGVADFTAHIEAMRSTRDLKNQDIDRLQREIQVGLDLHTAVTIKPFDIYLSLV